LQVLMAAYVVVGVCQEYMPVAQTIVLRRVLKGGISTNSGCLFFFLSSTDVSLWRVSWNGGERGWVV
ncbi:hypothetical protein, partial [Pseudarthrobacter siccitolerans]|uniref:hypothetical protein n=1 Tax=Pseudarthrobacter siccitolerans TaxID=861266 RepID=UPI001F226131